VKKRGVVVSKRGVNAVRSGLGTEGRRIESLVLDMM